MGLNQKKRFNTYPLATVVRGDTLLLAHDPVLGDVNIRVLDLISTLNLMSGTIQLLTDIGGSGKQCAAVARFVGKDDNDQDIWQLEVTTI